MESTMWCDHHQQYITEAVVLCIHTLADPTIPTFWYGPDQGDPDNGRPPTSQALCKSCGDDPNTPVENFGAFVCLLCYREQLTEPSQ